MPTWRHAVIFLCMGLIYNIIAIQYNTIIIVQYVMYCETCFRKRWTQTRYWPTKKSSMLRIAITLRTDTRHTHGSSTPVPALALILHTNENFFFQYTQLVWTASLGKKKDKYERLTWTVEEITQRKFIREHSLCFMNLSTFDSFNLDVNPKKCTVEECKGVSVWARLWTRKSCLHSWKSRQLP